MKALSLRPEWALPVLLGMKTVEYRSWKTGYRGKLLICSSNRPMNGYISGHALCTVDLESIDGFSENEHQKSLLKANAAMLDFVQSNGYAWKLTNLEWIEPFPVKGQLGLYEVDDSLIHVIPETIDDQEALERYFLPLVKWGLGDKEMREFWSGLIGRSL